MSENEATPKTDAIPDEVMAHAAELVLALQKLGTDTSDGLTSPALSISSCNNGSC